MKTSHLLIRVSLFCAAMLLYANAAQAQMAIRFVASYGSDANPCSRPAPCRTIQRGVDATAAGSELQILDSGEFGPTVTITKSITVSANGVTAAIHNTLAVPTISINNAAAVVVLRGLTLRGEGTGLRGIDITAAAAVHIERCELERFVQQGVRLNFANTNLFIKDTVARAMGTDGLLVNGNGTTTRVTVDNSRFENNGEDGLDIDGVQSSISHTVTSGNGGDGLEQSGGRTTVTWTTSMQNSNGFNVGFGGRLALENSVARGNASSGLNVAGSSFASISNSVFTHNSVGIQNSGTTETRQNNTVALNGTPVGGNALTPVAGT